MSSYSQFILLRKGSVQGGGSLVASMHFGKHRIEVLAFTPAPYEIPLQARGESVINVVVQTIDSGVVLMRANLGVIQAESSLPYFHFTRVTSEHVLWIEQAMRSQYLHNIPFVDWAIIAGDHFLGEDAHEIEDAWQYEQLDAMIESEEANDQAVVIFENKVGESFANWIETLPTELLDEESDDDTDNDG